MIALDTKRPRARNAPSARLWSALVVAGTVASAGCSSSQLSGGGAYGSADGGTPPCSAATCAGACTSGRCFVTLSTPPNNPCLAYDFVLGQTAVYWLQTEGYVLRVPTAVVG